MKKIVWSLFILLVILFVYFVYYSNLLLSNSVFIFVNNYLHSIVSNTKQTLQISPVFLQPNNGIVVLGKGSDNLYSYEFVGKFSSVDWSENLVYIEGLDLQRYCFRLSKKYLQYGDTAQANMERMWSTYPLLLVVRWNDERSLNVIMRDFFIDNLSIVNIGYPDSFSLTYTKYDKGIDRYVNDFGGTDVF